MSKSLGMAFAISIQFFASSAFAANVEVKSIVKIPERHQVVLTLVATDAYTQNCVVPDFTFHHGVKGDEKLIPPFSEDREHFLDGKYVPPFSPHDEGCDLSSSASRFSGGLEIQERPRLITEFFKIVFRKDVLCA